RLRASSRKSAILYACRSIRLNSGKPQVFAGRGSGVLSAIDTALLEDRHDFVDKILDGRRHDRRSHVVPVAARLAPDMFELVGYLLGRPDDLRLADRKTPADRHFTQSERLVVNDVAERLH